MFSIYTKNKDIETDVTNSPTTEPPKKEEIVLSKVEETIDQMTLEEKVGQLLVIGVEGTSFSSEMDNLIRNYHVGGVIIMGRNVATTNEILQLINGIKKQMNLIKPHYSFLSMKKEDVFPDCPSASLNCPRVRKLVNSMMNR